ncbi:MAG: hypothetical protein ACR2MY_15150 [Candidatus Dormibacteria bacterium]
MTRSPLLLGSKSESERAMRAGVVRIGLGAVMLLAPALGRRVFGVPDKQDNSAVRLLARLFGIRQIVLGAWAIQVQNSGADQRRMCYQLNAATDAVDVGALAVAGVFGEGLVQAAIMGSLLGTSEVLAWLDLLGDVDKEEPQGGSVALT